MTARPGNTVNKWKSDTEASHYSSSSSSKTERNRQCKPSEGKNRLNLGNRVSQTFGT